MLSAYASEEVGLYVGGEYLCLACGREKLGELRVSKLLAGLDVPGDWDPDGVVWRWEVDERLAEIEAVKAPARRAHKAIDWNEVGGLEWGTRCNECGDELAPEKSHVFVDGGVGICRFCWSDRESPIHGPVSEHPGPHVAAANSARAKPENPAVPLPRGERE